MYIYTGFHILKLVGMLYALVMAYPSESGFHLSVIIRLLCTVDYYTAKSKTEQSTR